jgi:hypothetical protein
MRPLAWQALHASCLSCTQQRARTHQSIHGIEGSMINAKEKNEEAGQNVE